MEFSQDHDSPVVMFKSDEAEMDTASKAARETFKYFWRELAWEQRRFVGSVP
ncbi:MAG: DUF2314 domain-containing protein [Verrucomicrobiales bacterium]